MAVPVSGGEDRARFARARRRTGEIGLEFHEVRVETNGHNLTLVFAELQVTRAAEGYAPFVTGAENHYVQPSPLAREEHAAFLARMAAADVAPEADPD